MLSWALTFFIIALIASLFGFGGTAATASGIGMTLIKVFLVLMIIGIVCRMAGVY